MKTIRLLLYLILAAVIILSSAVLPESSFPVTAKIWENWRYIPSLMNPPDIRADFTVPRKLK